MKALDTAKTIERRIGMLIRARRKAQLDQPAIANEIERKYHFAIHHMYQLANDLGIKLSERRIDRLITANE